MFDLSGLKIKSLVMNGAGPVKTIEDVFEIARSKTRAIVVGSITFKPRTGNKGKTYIFDSKNKFSINSKGLPNPGLDYYKENLSKMINVAQRHEKPLIVSIAGFTSDEYITLANEIYKLMPDGIEINLGCPNVWKNGKQKAIASFDIFLIEQILTKLKKTVGGKIWISLKFSPYSNPEELKSTARIINKFGFVNAIVTTNTFPNAYSKNVSGALGGKFLKPIGLGQVRQFKEVLNSNISIFGMGGYLQKKMWMII